MTAEYDLANYVDPNSYFTDTASNTGTINIGKIKNRAAANAADGTLVVASNTTEANVPITAFDPLKVPEVINYGQSNTVPAGYVQRVGMQLGRNLAEGESDRIAAFMADTAIDAGNRVQYNLSNATHGTIDNAVEAVELALQELDNKKVAHMGRYALVSPAMWRRLRRADFFGSKDFADSNITNNSTVQAAMASGVKWSAFPSPAFSADLSANTAYPSSLRVNFSTANVLAIIYHDTAFAKGLWEAPNVRTTDENLYQAYVSVARMHFGLAAVHTDGCIVIQDVGTPGAPAVL
jgi:hypothetical protein